jgi:hypothetical protein
LPVLDPRDDAALRFAEACRLGDADALRASLAADAIAICDGGGLVPVPTGPIHGARDVARLAAALLCGQPDTELTIEAVNGRPGLALRRGGHAVAVVGIEATGAGVTVLWFVLNPAKLRGWRRA